MKRRDEAEIEFLSREREKGQRRVKDKNARTRRKREDPMSPNVPEMLSSRRRLYHLYHHRDVSDEKVPGI